MGALALVVSSLKERCGSTGDQGQTDGERPSIEAQRVGTHLHWTSAIGEQFVSKRKGLGAAFEGSARRAFPPGGFEIEKRVDGLAEGRALVRGFESEMAGFSKAPLPAA